METKLNSAGEQQPMKPNGQYTFSNFKRNDDLMNKIENLKNQLSNSKSFLEKVRIKNQIEMLEGGFSSEEEYKAYKAKKYEEEQRRKEEEYQKTLADKKKKLESEEIARKKKLEEDYKTSTPIQRKQFEIIQKYNPMLDDYHTGIRSPKEIKTFEETIKDEDSFSWGDFTKKDALNAIKKGKITIYSSYPIKQGVFVSTSKKQAQEYAGGGNAKIYSMDIPLNKVAWINGDEGQFADID